MISSLALSMALSMAAAAAPDSSVNVCWGHPESRCYRISEGSVSETLKDMKVGTRKIDAKAEASLRKSVDEFKAWAESKKIVVRDAKKIEICRDVVSIHTKGASSVMTSIICVSSGPKKDTKKKETELFEALNAGKR